MRTVFITLSIIISTIVLVTVGFTAYAIYRSNNINDTHDLPKQVAKVCTDYIEANKGTGLFIGIVKGNELYAQGFGQVDKTGNITPDSNTVFEIGSISKVFTAGMVQLLVEQQQLSWNDAIQSHLPANVTMAYSKEIKLVNLVTHTSGLPRLPQSWFVKIIANECNPYATLTTDDLYSALADDGKRKHPSIDSYNYSNLGAGLLGHVLEWKTNKTYETLLQESICIPLHMPNTTTEKRESSTYATGYNAKGEKACYWNFPVLPGGGAIKSNGADMLRFLQANINNSTPLEKSLHKTHTQIAATPGGGVACGWHIDTWNGKLSGIDNIIWHNGGTGGFRSYIGFIPGTNTGIIVLSNQIHKDFDQLAIDIMLKAGTISMQ